MLGLHNFTRGLRWSAAPLQSAADGKAPATLAGATVEKVAGTSPSPAAASTPPGMPGRPRLNPTALDKIFLVWSGHFKTKAEIPASLEYDVIEKTRSWARIRINLVAIGIAAAGSVLMVYLGKQAAKRGEFVEAGNLEWHRQNKEEYLRSNPQSKKEQ